MSTLPMNLVYDLSAASSTGVAKVAILPTQQNRLSHLIDFSGSLVLDVMGER